MEEFIGELIGALIVMVPIGIRLWHQFYNDRQKSNKQIANKLRSYISFDENTSTLTVYDLHPQISRVVTMDRYEILHTAYQPESYTYTSVRVGNVTIGDVSKNEAYKYISSSSKTEKYELKYLGKYIKKIKLCGQDVIDKAKQSGMEQYMNSAGEIVVVGNASVSQDAMKSALTGYYAQIQYEMFDAQPDYDKCSRILSFLNSAKRQSILKRKCGLSKRKKIVDPVVGFRVFAFVFPLLIVIICGGIFLHISIQSETRAVLSGLKNTKIILVDPADLGFEGEEGYCSTIQYGYYSDHKYYFSFHTQNDDNQEYLYKYTVHPKMKKGNSFYLTLKLLEEESADDTSSEHGNPPKKITGLRLVAFKYNDEYTTFVLKDRNGNILAHSPYVELTYAESW